MNDARRITVGPIAAAYLEIQQGTVLVLATDYDDLHADIKALRLQNAMFVTAAVNISNDREALLAENERLSQQLAQSDSALRESRANDMANVRTLEDMWERHDALRQEMEAARGLLGMMASALFEERNEYEDTPAHILNATNAYEIWMSATPAPEVQAETLDDRLKQAGMLSVAELLKGAPLDAFIKHAGVHDLATLLQWAEMRRGEYLRMMARYDLGEKDKGDDLYEWTVAHCAAFTELHVNLRAALADQGERQEAVPEETPHIIVFDDADRPNEMFSGAGARPAALRRWEQISVSWNAHLFVRVEKNSRDDPNPCARLATIPQPGPDVRGLVRAVDLYLAVVSDRSASSNAISAHRAAMAEALAAHRQAQRQA